ncbi:MAG: SDR family NAD(P)-dependent oxidoreductase [Pirellulales bacterium]
MGPQHLISESGHAARDSAAHGGATGEAAHWNNGRALGADALAMLAASGRLSEHVDGRDQVSLEELFASLLRPQVSGEQLLDEFHVAAQVDASHTLIAARRYHAHCKTAALVLGTGAVDLALAELLGNISDVRLAIGVTNDAEATRARERMSRAAVDRWELIRLDAAQGEAAFSRAVFDAAERLDGLDFLHVGRCIASAEHQVGGESNEGVDAAQIGRDAQRRQFDALAAVMAGAQLDAGYTIVSGHVDRGSGLAGRMAAASMRRLAEGLPAHVAGVCWQAIGMLTPDSAPGASDELVENGRGFLVTPRQVAEGLLWLSAFWKPELFGQHYFRQDRAGRQVVDTSRYIAVGHHQVTFPGPFAAERLSGRSGDLPERLAAALHTARVERGTETDTTHAEVLASIRTGRQLDGPREALPSRPTARLRHRRAEDCRHAPIVPPPIEAQADPMAVRPYTARELKELATSGKLGDLIGGRTQDELETIFRVTLRPRVSGEEILDEFHFTRLLQTNATIGQARQFHAESQTRVLIVGAGGIGLAVAKWFGAIPGVKLAITSRNAAKAAAVRDQLSAKGVKAYLDVRIDSDGSPAAYERAVESASERLGGLDVVFVGLGSCDDDDVLRSDEPLSADGVQRKLARLKELFDVNQLYPLAVAEAASRLGVRCTLLPGSIHGRHLQNKHVVTYGMTKAALDTLAEAPSAGGQRISWRADYVLSEMTAPIALAAMRGTKCGFLLTPRQIAEAVAWLTAFWKPELLADGPDGDTSADETDARSAARRQQRWLRQGHHVVDMPGDSAAEYLRGCEVPVIAERFAATADGLYKRCPLAVGKVFTHRRELTAEDVAEAIRLWGDSPDDAAQAAQRGKIVLGMLVSALLGSPSQASSFGAQLPGGIYIRQSLEVLAEDWQARILRGPAEAVAHITHAYAHPSRPGKAIVRLHTEIVDAERIVLASGEAELLVSAPAEQVQELPPYPASEIESPPSDPLPRRLNVAEVKAVAGSFALEPRPAGDATQSDRVMSRRREELRRQAEANWQRLPGELFAFDFNHNVTIGGVGLCTPANRYTNADLARLAEEKRLEILRTIDMYRRAGLTPPIEDYNDSLHYRAERFETLGTGITSRYWIGKEESIGQLAAKATLEALEETLYPLPLAALRMPGVMQRLGFTIAAVATHDGDFTAPGLGDQVNQYLDLQCPLPTLSSKGYCVGYLGALFDRLPHVGTGVCKLAVIPVAEVYSRYLRPDQSCWPIFGDLAVASTLVPAREGHGIHWMIHQTDSSQRRIVVPRLGETNDPLGEIMRTPHGGFFDLKGREVGIMAGHAITFLVERVREFIRSGLHDIGHRDPGRIDWYIFHQANQGLILRVTDALGIPRDKILWTIDTYGNTSAASSTSVLHAHRDRIREGDLIFRADFGGVFTHAGMLMTWGGSTLRDAITGDHLRARQSNQVASTSGMGEPEDGGSTYLQAIGISKPPGARLPRYMRAWGVRRGEHGPPGQAIVEHVRPLPELGHHDVLVQVMAASLNFNGSWAALGLPVSPFQYPRIRHKDFQVLGSDAAGIVMAVGAKVRDVAVGDQVVMATGEDDRGESDPACGDNTKKRSFHITGYENADGTFAQYVRLDERQVLPKPERLAWEDAASYMLVGATAWRALKYRAAVRPGDTVLIWGGSRGTGLYGVQVARLLGAKHIVAVVSSQEGSLTAKEYGATAVLNRKELPRDIWGVIPADEAGRQRWRCGAETFIEKFRAATGGNLADVVMEHPGAATYPLSVEVLKSSGKITHFAGTTGYKFTFMGKELDRSPIDVLTEGGLRQGAKVVIFGADPLARQMLEVVGEHGAAAAVVVRGAQQATEVRAWDPEEKVLRGTIDLAEFPVPDDMPSPPHPDEPSEDDAIHEQYRTDTLVPFRNAVRAAFNGQFPDLMIHRAEETQTLDLSAFAVKPHGSVAFVESTSGYRYAFDARYVWMFQKKILPWIVGTHYASHAQAAEFNQLVVDGAIEVPPVEVFAWEELPQAQQRMLEGNLAAPKASILVGAATAGLTGQQGTDDAADETPLGQDATARALAVRLPIVRISGPRRLDEGLVDRMVRVSGDDNPVHRSDEAARQAGFDGRIAHGMLVAGLIPQYLAELGWLKHAQYESQELVFAAPVYVAGQDELRVVVEVRHAQADCEHVRLNLRSTVQRCDPVSGRWDEVLVGTSILKIAPDVLRRPRAVFSMQPDELFV